MSYVEYPADNFDPV